MFLRQRTDWYYSLGFDYGLDFAVWVLEQSGLQVPPFDQHSAVSSAAGSPESLRGIPPSSSDDERFPLPNPLRSLGFTPDKWRIWLHQISLNTVDAQSRRLPDRPPKGPISLIDPASLHPGSPALQDALRDRHRVYREAIGNQRKLVERMVIQFQQVEVKQLRAHWQMMSEARGKLPPVRYFIVAYPFRVVYAVPPASVILAFGTLPDKANYWNLLINGLKQLQN